MFGEATAQSRCQICAALKLTEKNINVGSGGRSTFPMQCPISGEAKDSKAGEKSQCSTSVIDKNTLSNN